MPTRAARICPRCKQPITGKRCLTCTARTLANLSKRATANKPRNPYAYNPQWRAISREFLRLHPVCESETCERLPLLARPKSIVTDHIDGLGLHGPRAYDATNFMALCLPCHARKTIRHDGGLGNVINRKQC